MTSDQSWDKLLAFPVCLHALIELYCYDLATQEFETLISQKENFSYLISPWPV